MSFCVSMQIVYIKANLIKHGPWNLAVVLDFNGLLSQFTSVVPGDQELVRQRWDSVFLSVYFPRKFNWWSLYVADDIIFQHGWASSSFDNWLPLQWSHYTLPLSPRLEPYSKFDSHARRRSDFRYTRDRYQFTVWHHNVLIDILKHMS